MEGLIKQVGQLRLGVGVLAGHGVLPCCHSQASPLRHTSCEGTKLSCVAYTALLVSTLLLHLALQLLYHVSSCNPLLLGSERAEGLSPGPCRQTRTTMAS